MTIRKVPYRVRFHEDSPPPSPAVKGSRWDLVLDRLLSLGEEEGTIDISIPKALVKKEQASLRGAIERWRRDRGNKFRFSVRMTDTGLVVYRPSRERWEKDLGNLPIEYDRPTGEE